MKTKLNNYIQAVESGELVKFADAENGESPKLRTFSMLAYNGGVMRFWGESIVVDLASMKVSTKPRPILRDHNPSMVVGHTETINRGTANLRVSGIMSGANMATDELVKSSDNGVPWQASIGIDVGKYVFVEAGAKTTVNGREFSGPLYVAKNSTLKEVSFVALGADDNTTARVAAGANQGNEIGVHTMKFEAWLEGMGLQASALEQDQLTKLQAKFDAEIKASEKPEEKPIKAGADDAIGQMKQEMKAAAAEAAKELAGLKAAAGDDMELYAEAIQAGWSAEVLKDKAELKRLRAGRPSGPGIHMVVKDTSPKVIEAALCISRRHDDLEKSFKPEVLEAADKQYRHMGFQQMFLLAAAANGYSVRPGESINAGNMREILSHAFPPRGLSASFSTLSLPGILSSVANKEILAGYMEEDQTWREVAMVKSVTDFKEITSYRMLDNMEYEALPKHGEIKHGSLGEESYTRQVRTYAKMFSLDRVDIINDDLSAFDDLRTRVGAGAAKKLNNVFWTRWLDNSTFYTSGRGNYITGADSVLGADGLQKGITAFRKLKSPAADGEKRLLVGGRPEILLVPAELEFTAEQLYQSTNVNTGGSSTKDAVPNANIHAGKYKPVVCDWLSDADFTGYSSTAWYLLRAPRNMAAAVVSFLNGVEIPTVDAAEADFNQLGVQLRGYHDFGVDLAEYLAGIKSKGAA